MPPKKKDPEPVAPPVVEAVVAPTPEPVPEPAIIVDAGLALYRDKSGPARSNSNSEGAGYSRTMANNARAAVGLPPLEDS